MAAPSYVSTIGRVAKMLGEDEDLLHDIAMDMEPEDGRLWVLGPDDDKRTSPSRPSGSRASSSCSTTTRNAVAPDLLSAGKQPRRSADGYGLVASPSRSLAQLPSLPPTITVPIAQRLCGCRDHDEAVRGRARAREPLQQPSMPFSSHHARRASSVALLSKSYHLWSMLPDCSNCLKRTYTPFLGKTLPRYS